MRYWVVVTWTDGHKEIHALTYEEILEASNASGVDSVRPAKVDEVPVPENPIPKDQEMWGTPQSVLDEIAKKKAEAADGS